MNSIVNWLSKLSITVLLLFNFEIGYVLAAENDQFFNYCPTIYTASSEYHSEECKNGCANFEECMKFACSCIKNAAYISHRIVPPAQGNLESYTGAVNYLGETINFAGENLAAARTTSNLLTLSMIQGAEEYAIWENEYRNLLGNRNQIAKSESQDRDSSGGILGKLEDAWDDLGNATGALVLVNPNAIIFKDVQDEFAEDFKAIDNLVRAGRDELRDGKEAFLDLIDDTLGRHCKEKEEKGEDCRVPTGSVTISGDGDIGVDLLDIYGNSSGVPEGAPQWAKQFHGSGETAALVSYENLQTALNAPFRSPSSESGFDLTFGVLAKEIHSKVLSEVFGTEGRLTYGLTIDTFHVVTNPNIKTPEAAAATIASATVSEFVPDVRDFVLKKTFMQLGLGRYTQTVIRGVSFVFAPNVLGDPDDPIYIDSPWVEIDTISGNEQRIEVVPNYSRLTSEQQKLLKQALEDYRLDPLNLKPGTEWLIEILIENGEPQLKQR